MELIARSTVSIAIIILLFLVDPKLAFIIGFSLGGAYGVIYFFTRRYLNRIGEQSLQQNNLRFKSIIEAFGASKEVKVGGLEKNFVKNFAKPAKIFALNQASTEIISTLPRFILEAIAFGGILLMILYMMLQSGSFYSALPIISLYVFAGYRLLPALQEIYSSFIQITYTKPSIDKIYQDAKSLEPINLNQEEGILPFNKVISLKNITYNYPNASKVSLKNISLNISFKNTIGIVGATGSGKTTTVDIILGLLEAQKGTLEVDGKIIDKNNIRSWQNSIGYVPQNIYLSDDTIAANIAFGVEPKDIDYKSVEKAAKIANLHDFVLEELPAKYDTIIGERGVRLSGGQRQRIGIARALYNNPNVLIFDESTNSLDNLTEQVIIEALNNLSSQVTIIIISHRIKTIENCNQIFLMDHGKIIARGNYDELSKNSIEFNKFISTNK